LQLSQYRGPTLREFAVDPRKEYAVATIQASHPITERGQAMSQYDVITLGETMLRLTPPGFKRIEQTIMFELEVGGTEANVAIGLVRLGLKALWISRLTANPVGRIIERTLAGYGVDTSHVIWTDEDRVGLYFYERGKSPRDSQVVYDRRQSAISRMQPAELPLELFRPDSARLLHLTGITPALSPNLADTARRALDLAKKAGWLVSFDLNFRSLLWTPATARIGCTPFMAAADILLAPFNDVRLLFDLDPAVTPRQALDLLKTHHPQATIVMTLGAQGAIASEPDGQVIEQPAFPAEEVGRLGGGDAFAAGFLYGALTTTGAEDRLARALRWGAAAAAIKYTIPGDIPVFDHAEVAALVEQGPGGTKLKR
jgi:2-dehydro-3-deoxygluconokinase